MSTSGMEGVNVTEQPFQNACRACLARDQKTKTIFDLEFEYKSFKIIDMLSAVLPQLYISNSDALPKSICVACLEILNIAYKFQEMCIVSENYMRSMLTGDISEIKCEFKNFTTPVSSTSKSSTFEEASHQMEQFIKSEATTLNDEDPLQKEDRLQEYFKMETSDEELNDFDLVKSIDEQIKKSGNIDLPQEEEDTTSDLPGECSTGKKKNVKMENDRVREFCLNVKIGEKVNLIWIKTGDDGCGILQKISNAFDIPKENLELIKNNLGAEIPLSILSDVVHQHSKSASFFLEINVAEIPQRFSNLKRRNNAMINKEILIKHLRENDCSYILKEYEEKKALCDTSRRAIVNQTVDLLRSRCSDFPSTEQKMSASKAILSIFTCYKSVDESQNIFFDRTTSTGYLAARLKYLNTKKNTRNRLTGTQSKTQSTETEDSDHEVLQQHDIEFFSNCVLPSQRIALQDKLRQTLSARKVLCRDFITIKEMFPFFFVEPELILFDFDLRYPENSNKLFDLWPRFSAKIKDVFNECISGKEKVDCIYDWSNEIQPFLFLLKLLPPTAAGNKSKNLYRPNFQGCINNFIRFENLVTPTQKYNVFAETPFLIARGANKLAINQFMIVVDSKIIPLPAEYGLQKAFDVLFKAFFIFNIHFSSSLRNFFKFFSKYIFGFENDKVSRRCNEIFLKLKSKIDDEEIV